ncbi:sel1 repeat family protein [Asticcacaulis biprosthecium C19]|uniref:Sel1 repeat family protein n=1 Tax=Asticcacaulis biprosthecium C19 TaxID=715226 RepID=F4QR26_9CAUL|nr:tetratricopeptide repeat protein [Asticcacaulis biprosthecium]EGF90663.1 sel1 repeat family protein [Asticcacaulis biprosthecium C19]
MFVRSLFIAALCLLPAAAFAQSPADLPQRAEAGDADSQLDYGLKFYNGDGVQQDRGTALKWFRKSADQGNVDASYLAGQIYADNKHLPFAPGRARKYLTIAAEAKLSHAQQELVDLLIESLIVTQSCADARDAISWLKRLAENADATSEERSEAEDNLVTIYLQEKNFWGYIPQLAPRDVPEAKYWLSRGVERGDPYAAEQMAAIDDQVESRPDICSHPLQGLISTQEHWRTE